MGQPSRLAALARALVTACALLVLLGAVGPAAAAHPLSAPANWTTSAPERASGFRPEARSAEATRLRSPIRRPLRRRRPPLHGRAGLLPSWTGTAAAASARAAFRSARARLLATLAAADALKRGPPPAG